MKFRIPRAILIEAGLVGALFFILPLLYFAPVTLGDRTLLPADNVYQYEPWAAYADEVGAGTPQNHLLSDLILENYPWKKFIRERLSEGDIPLWNPYLFAGVPFLAAGQHSALYPFSAIFYVMPLERAYGWFTVSQLALAGVCMYAFLRGIGIGPVGAALAGLAYQFSSFYLVSVVFSMIIAAAAWLPLLLLMLEWIIRRQPLFGKPAALPWALIGGAALACQIFAGHIEITYYTLLIMGLYAAWRLAVRWRRGRNWRELIVPAAACAALVIFGVGLAAVQFVPLVELVGRNFRSGSAELEQVLEWAYPKRRVLAFLMPNFFGNPSHHTYWDVFANQIRPATVNALGEPITFIDWGIKNYVEGGAYMGLLTMALAAVGILNAIFERTKRAVIAIPGFPRAFFALLAAASVTFVFGLPTYAILFRLLPGVDQLHSPFRWVWPLTVSVCVLAGFGAEALVRKGQGGYDADEDVPRSFTFRLARWMGWGAIGIGTLVLVGLALSRALYPQIAPLVERALNSLALAETAFADAEMFYSYEFRNVLFFGLFLIVTGVVLRVSRCPIYLPERLKRRPVWELLAAVVIVLDLGVASFGFNPAVDPDLLAFEPPAAVWLRENVGLYRITSFDAPGARTFNANTPWFYNIADVRGYDSIIPKQYADYMALIAPQYQLLYNRIAPIPTDRAYALDSPLLDLLGVKYVVTEETIDNPRLTPVYEDAAVRVYENVDVMPRAYTLPESAQVAIANFADAVQNLDPRYHVLIETPGAPDLPDPRPAEPVPAAIRSYSPREVLIDVEVEADSWLILTDSHFPGWRAFRRPLGTGEDEEVQVGEIALVNGNFRGVRVPAGNWTLRYRYTPPSFQVGAFGSFLTLMIGVFALGVWAWRRFYTEGGDSSLARRVAKNSFAPIVLNLFNKGIDFARAAIMLRILGPGDAGIYSYAIVIFLWFDILTNFGLNTLLTREAARHKDGAGRYLLNSSILRIGLANAAIPLLGIFLLVRQAAVSPPLESRAIIAILLLYAGLLPSSISTGLTALFYAFEKAEYPAAIQTVSTLLNAALSLTVLILGWGVIGLAGVSIVVNLITLSILAWLSRAFIGPVRALWDQRDRDLIRHMIGESWPLMINHLLATIFFKLDVILLEAFRGVMVVGWYSSAYKWLDAINVIPGMLSTALLPVMAVQAHEDKDGLARNYRFVVKLLVLIALPLAVGSMFVAEMLVGVLGGASFLPHGAIALQIMIWSIPFGWINSITNYLIVALDSQRALTWTFVAGVSFNVIANVIFVPTYGYPAAAVTSILSEIVLLGAFYVLVRRDLEPIPWLRMLWRPAAAAALMLSAILIVRPLSEIVALAVGVAVYGGALWVLKPLNADERAQLRDLLPG